MKFTDFQPHHEPLQIALGLYYLSRHHMLKGVFRIEIGRFRKF